jgi:imidazolonepropionase-like amidohydrolase
MRIDLDEPANIIASATRINADLLNQRGSLGTISPGAYADLLVVQGDPLRDVRVLTDPARNLKFIMKDGIIYKNEL